MNVPTNKHALRKKLTEPLVHKKMCLKMNGFRHSIVEIFDSIPSAIVAVISRESVVACLFYGIVQRCSNYACETLTSTVQAY